MKNIKNNNNVEKNYFAKIFKDTIYTKLMILMFLNTLAISAQEENINYEDSKNYPIIPFNTNFWNYWDHYWTTWLDDHPKYEAIELTTFDNPENPDYKLIRVFLSEKSGRKEQYFYLNDSLAVKRSRTNSFFRNIKYEKSGKFGSPQNLSLEFVDKDNLSIKWNIDFDSNLRLKKHIKGLTPSIHSVGYILLYHLRRETQSTYNETILIDGIDYAPKKTSNGIKERESWYNKGVYSSVVIFGRLKFKNENGIISNNWGRIFKPIEGNQFIYRSNYLGPKNYIEFEVDSLNQIKTYQQLSFGHSFKFSFIPPLPNRLTAKTGQVINYTVSFDDKKDLMNGKITIEKAKDILTLSWKQLNPNWAKKRPFKSIITFDEKGNYELQTLEINN